MATVERVLALRPTRRGVGVAVVVTLAFALGVTAGARSLNAVLVPALVGLAAGAVQLIQADPPTIERSAPPPGFAGDGRRVRVAVESDVPCTVTDRVGDGVAANDPSATVGHGGAFEYELEYRRRGRHRVGPATCRLTDSLGLFARRVETEGETTALVYPDVYAVTGDGLSALVRRVLGHDRSSFDRLRAYSPGDSMRDIHWRASAKRAEEFVVAEYRSDAETSHVAVVGEAAPGGADAMAATVASVAMHLLDAGVSVAVSVTGGRVVAHPGDAASLLQLLALTGDGRVDGEARAAADVRVSAGDGRATVSLDDRELEFAEVAGGHRGREVVA
jgi:uncharacterized protein (DUF58 family)